MLSAGRMTERVRVYRKQATGTSPEAWTTDGVARRASIWRISDAHALTESSQHEYLYAVTHHAVVDYDADAFSPIGFGARLLKRLNDDREWWLLRAVETGLRGRDGHYRYMRLSLAEKEPEVIT